MRSVRHWLGDSDQADFRILMGHLPNYATAMQEQPIDLCLAGHTHGGQVRVPFYGALTTYSEIPREWARGFRRIGVPYLNVSAGAGSNRRHGLPPIRFNCPTEMTLIELVPMQGLIARRCGAAWVSSRGWLEDDEPDEREGEDQDDDAETRLFLFCQSHAVTRNNSLSSQGLNSRERGLGSAGCVFFCPFCFGSAFVWLRDDAA